MAEKHSILGGKVRVYKRPGSQVWQCSVYLGGRNHRVSTKEESLSSAKDFAEYWFFGLREKERHGELLNEKTFRHAADQFKREYEVLTEGERNSIWVKDHYRRIDLHLAPFFGKLGLSTITSGTVQEYKISRLKPEDKDARVPSRSTLHHEMVTLRMVMKAAVRHGWLQHLPDLSEPYKASNKVVHRAWFSPDECKRLYTATRQKMHENKGQQFAHVWANLHDKVLFMANTGLRPDEAKRLEYRDV
jgi:integrase